ncbi:Vta1 like-domain-containing protein [Sphaerosporella brunnea]|uniref:Vta1 like-domain-containing protein n=1 Tax=Sphaerosporella brunnea TaxID=1250544 RepID=A0A5J5ELR5_9PEZI|nr:Vta1 like-domain-containing protein [Sphaerosporella brunnea]
MLPQPPDTLKAIRPFIQRGNQMAAIDAVITYYCYFYAVRLALSKGLHTASPESTDYVSSVMEELEQRKETLKGDDRIDDDLVARAYVENFATRIFENGSRVINAGTATEKTPDTLQAAAVFLELVRIFDEADEEVAKKIMYAKFHAARILKAVKEGKEINPPPAEATPSPAMRPQATVEDVPDGGEPLRPLDQKPPREYASPSLPDVPPAVPDQQHEYFMPVSEVREPEAPPLTAPSMGVAPDLHTHLPPPASPPPTAFPPSPPAFQQPIAPPPVSNFQSTPPPMSHFQPTPAFHPTPVFHPTPTAPPLQQYSQPPTQEISEENINKAQKYAKWAISALDYEDVDNAILQLRSALAALGVRP